MNSEKGDRAFCMNIDWPNEIEKAYIGIYI